MRLEMLNNIIVVQYSDEIKTYLNIVLNENMSQCVTDQIVEKYYNNIVKYLIDGSAIVIGAFDKDNLIGLHWAYETNVLNERRLHSSFDIVNEKYRGQGIGTAMFKMLEKICIERNIHIIEAMVTCANEVAMKYHEKNGFTIERVKVSKHI